MAGRSKNFFISILIAITIAAVSAQGGIKIYQEIVGSKNYKLYNKKLNWGDAFIVCKAENADLLTIDSQPEMVYIRKFIENAGIRNFTFEHFWTSGSDIYNEGHHIWMSNGREILKTLWHNNQPDNWGKNEHCHELLGLALNDVPCTDTINFICQKMVGNQQGCVLSG